jgi:orotate phosphoribosyltransferase
VRAQPDGYGALMEGTEIEALLREWGALLVDDHFVYVSGEHGPGWIDKDVVYPHTDRTSALAQLIADRVSGRDIDVVCGPATGGLILAQWIAHHLGVLATFGEHADAANPGNEANARRPFVLRRGYDRLVEGKNVLVVDDVINTGFSISGIIDAVRSCGATVNVAASVCNRGAMTAELLGVGELVNLADIRLDSWPPAECPLCRRGVPVNTAYAHGADYVAAGGSWP